MRIIFFLTTISDANDVDSKRFASMRQRTSGRKRLICNNLIFSHAYILRNVSQIRELEILKHIFHRRSNIRFEIVILGHGCSHYKSLYGTRCLCYFHFELKLMGLR